MLTRLAAFLLAIVAAPVVALLALPLSVSLAAPLAAQQAPAPSTPEMPAEVARLYEALALDEILGIMRLEGIAYGEEIARDLFGGQGGAAWNATVADIYDPERMRAQVRDTLAGTLGEADLGPAIDFFTGTPGSRIIALEVSARRALLDVAVEEASKEAAALAMLDETPRLAQIKRFVEVNDLIETNVVGALNANYAFYMGLMDGGAVPGDLGTDDLLAEVWSQEPEVRRSTTEWVYSYLLMAYQPLDDAELDAYIAFSATPAGRALNQAVFTAFGDMFEGISRALGRASSRHMTGQEL